MAITRIKPENTVGEEVLVGLCKKHKKALENADAALLQVYAETPPRCNICGSPSETKREVLVRIVEMGELAGPSDYASAHVAVT